MSNPKSKISNAEVDTILNYVDSSKGLTFRAGEAGRISVRQKTDGKEFHFSSHELADVLHRADTDGKPFLQLNFKSGNKVLLTDQLVGFKPYETLGLDMGRLPKVVTTPDLLSVGEAIEEALGSETADHEIEVLRKVYQAILVGAERIGFELPFERAWATRLLASRFRASA